MLTAGGKSEAEETLGNLQGMNFVGSSATGRLCPVSQQQAVAHSIGTGTCLDDDEGLQVF